MSEKEFKQECFRLEFHHEYKTAGKTIKTEEPLFVEIVMDSGKFYEIPGLKQDIVRTLSEKMIRDLIKDEMHDR